jgi:hypothetical protein
MPCLYLLPINTISKIGITSVSGTSSFIVDSKFNESLREHLQEAARIWNILTCTKMKIIKSVGAIVPSRGGGFAFSLERVTLEGG